MSDWRVATAIRYTQSSAGDGLVSFMSFISISGLVLGVAVLVIVLSVMNGFERELRLRVLGVLPHGVIASETGFVNWQAVSQQAERHPEVTGSAPFLEGGGLLVANGIVAGVSYIGIDPSLEDKVSIVGRYYTKGSPRSLQPRTFNLSLGVILAKRLGVEMGDKISLVLPDAQLTLAGPVARTRRFTVSGIFQVGSDIDKGQIFINLQDGLRLNRQSQLNAIRIATNDLFAAPRILHEIVTGLGQAEIYGNSWQRRHGNLYEAIQMQKSTMFMLLLMLIAVAGFNVVSNLVMVVNEKKAAIAILRTMGARTNEILSIFVLHGLLIGLVGVFLGLALGVLVSNYITEVYELLDGVLQLGLMDEYFIHYLPAEILIDDLVQIGSISIFICFIVTLYPARIAARANPVEALQYE
ncbi:MAG: lipoprotein-releasing ABC transporter permease subunit [Pseudomonadales bacterium]|nr:lipoprotein-releasing ABC transporter permease subunit [Pseudomonadales bacterium]